MTKKIIIAVVVVVVLAILGFLYMDYKAEEELQEFANSAESTGTVPTTSTTSVSTAFATYTMANIAAHNTRTDCWMTINGQVLDVTGFVDKHPGGTVILQGCGKDASGYFNNVPQHMKGIAQMLLKKLAIGKLAN